ncbi:MAG TPA: alpha/beta fold hydrolase, partial [Thermoleophilaceae bacterium]|nr:alpha/beta fold hydrolase [Thermoleophilaceae bacterium]
SAAVRPASCRTIFDLPGASCGTITVPLDRNGAVPGHVKLFTELDRVRGGADNSTIVVFPGGPGGATTTEARGFVHDLGRARNGHDLLVFDQRGTGRSDYLDCDLALTPNYYSPPGEDAHQIGKGVERCAKMLGARRGFYTTRETVADLEDVRKALGIDKFVLYGVSYGTRDAMAYAQAHPDHVDRVVLDSAVTPAGPDPFGMTGLRAIPRVLTQLCRGDGCNGIAADPAADLRTLVGRLEKGPMRAKQRVTLMGCGIRPAITRSRIFGLLQQVDENPDLLSQLPVALAEAAKGRPFQLSELEAGQSQYLLFCAFSKVLQQLIGPTKSLEDDLQLADKTFSTGDQIARLCEESPLPWPRDALPSQRQWLAESSLAGFGDDVFAPLDRATIIAGSLVPLCKFWIAENKQAPSGAMELPSVPTLIVSGLDDLRTPTEDARALAAATPGAQLLEVPDVGHSVIQSSGCARRALARFMLDQPISPCPTPAEHVPKPARRVISLQEQFDAILKKVPKLPSIDALRAR